MSEYGAHDRQCLIHASAFLESSESRGRGCISLLGYDILDIYGDQTNSCNDRAIF